jgi:ribosomal protein L11 methyltransferase
MAWLSLEFVLDAAEAEAFGDALMGEGALSVSLEDAAAGTDAERPLFGEPGTLPAREAWGRSVLRALVEPEADLTALVAAAAGEAGLRAVPTWHAAPVADADWVRLTQSQFDPIRISARLWIVPTWHEPPDAQAINLVLDPGVAFGTGAHATTRLCLRWLEAHIRGGERVLDYGCGSGILAIAAMKLGAGTATGVDIDAAAVAQARENARANAVAVAFRGADAPLDLQADLVVANILANPLKLLAPALTRHVRPGGRLALAGLLAGQAEEVSECYAPAFALEVAAIDEGWALLAGERRAT